MTDHTADLQSELTAAAERIQSKGRGAALTGAGISAESGISTYRDKGGLWDRYGEGAGGGILAVLAARPDQAHEILGGFFDSLFNARPNPGHLAMADLERMGYLDCIITQNVDDLHRRAGAENVHELHGNMFRLRCLSCSKTARPDRDEYERLCRLIVKTIAEKSLEAVFDVLPKCECGGVMRQDFVSFGEAVQSLEPAIRCASSANWMLIAGTSGVVHPAASIPAYARKNKALIVEINPAPSELTPMCDVFLKGAAGEVLPRLAEILKKL